MTQSRRYKQRKTGDAKNRKQKALISYDLLHSRFAGQSLSLLHFLEKPLKLVFFQHRQSSPVVVSDHKESDLQNNHLVLPALIVVNVKIVTKEIEIKTSEILFPT